MKYEKYPNSNSCFPKYELFDSLLGVKTLIEWTVTLINPEQFYSYKRQFTIYLCPAVMHYFTSLIHWK